MSVQVRLVSSDYVDQVKSGQVGLVMSAQVRLGRPGHVMSGQVRLVQVSQVRSGRSGHVKSGQVE